MKLNKSRMETSETSATVEVGDQASTEQLNTGKPLEEGPLVETLPQELSSLQLTGEPVIIQRKKKPSGAQRKRLRKQKKATAAQRAKGGLRARGAHSDKSCTGTDVNTEGSSRTKRPLSPGGTHQDAQSQVKRTKQSYKDALDASLQVVVVDKDDPSRQFAAEKATYLWQEIVELIDEEPDSPAPPQFSESDLVQGALRVTCAD